MLASRGQSLADVQAFPGLGEVDPWALDARAPRPHPGGGAAAPPPAPRRRGDRPPRQGEGGRLRAQGRDEGRRRADQAGRGEPRGGEGGDRALPARGAERPRRERAGRQGRRRQRRGPTGGRAARLRLRAEVALGPRPRARHPRLRAGGPDLGRALRRLLGHGRAARAGAHPVHARPAHGSRGYREVIPPYLVTAETLTGHRPAARSSRATSSRPRPATATST